MDNQEAIKILRQYDVSDLHFYSTDGEEIPFAEWSDAIEMAISALGKQIPKKPIRIDKNKEFDGNWKKVCPLCGRILIERITTPEESFPVYHNYTCHCLCGQAIDWMEDER